MIQCLAKKDDCQQIPFSFMNFWTLLREQAFGNWICFHPLVQRQAVPTQFGQLDKPNHSHCFSGQS
jgi:hypothetical protein